LLPSSILARAFCPSRQSTAALETVPGDGPSLAFIKRIGDLQANPPAADWDGAWHLDQK